MRAGNGHGEPSLTAKISSRLPSPGVSAGHDLMRSIADDPNSRTSNVRRGSGSRRNTLLLPLLPRWWNWRERSVDASVTHVRYRWIRRS